MLFYLGTHKANWLEKTDVPLFVSHRILAKRKRLPKAVGPWALDSGGFTELSMHGYWTVSPREYIDAVRRYHDEIGGLQWASQQDWMCEPGIIAKTELSVEEHQHRTIENLLQLRHLAPDIRWLPVVQGWAPEQYLAHVEMWRDAGVDLSREGLVGIGSVCRRQRMDVASQIIRLVAQRGIALHGFGFKLTGLRKVGDVLVSSDSMAWSFRARRADPLPGCSHANCANCLKFALQWRERAVQAASERGMRQEALL